MAHFFSSHWNCVDVESQVQLLKHFYFLELEGEGGRAAYKNPFQLKSVSPFWTLHRFHEFNPKDRR